MAQSIMLLIKISLPFSSFSNHLPYQHSIPHPPSPFISLPSDFCFLSWTISFCFPPLHIFLSSNYFHDINLYLYIIHKWILYYAFYVLYSAQQNFTNGESMETLYCSLYQKKEYERQKLSNLQVITKPLMLSNGGSQHPSKLVLLQLLDTNLLELLVY